MQNDDGQSDARTPTTAREQSKQEAPRPGTERVHREVSGFEEQVFTLISREYTPGRKRSLVDILVCHLDQKWIPKAAAVHISWREPLKTLPADIAKRREEYLARLSGLNAQREAEQAECVRRLVVGLASLGFAAQAQVRWDDILTADQRLLIRRLRSTRSIYAALRQSLLAGPQDLALEIASLLGYATTYLDDKETAERQRKIQAGEWVDITAAAAMLRVSVKTARSILFPMWTFEWRHNGLRQKHYYARSAVVAVGNRRGFRVVEEA